MFTWTQDPEDHLVFFAFTPFGDFKIRPGVWSDDPNWIVDTPHKGTMGFSTLGAAKRAVENVVSFLAVGG